MDIFVLIKMIWFSLYSISTFSNFSLFFGSRNAKKIVHFIDTTLDVNAAWEIMESSTQSIVLFVEVWSSVDKIFDSV